MEPVMSRMIGMFPMNLRIQEIELGSLSLKYSDILKYFDWYNYIF